MRTALALICLAVGALVLIVWGAPVVFTRPGEVPYVSRPYNELTKAAVDLAADQSKSLFQLGLLVLAALWALVFAKKAEKTIVLADTPEVTMFVTATVLLFFSQLCHLFYLGHVRYFLSVAGAVFDKDKPIIPDLFAVALAGQVHAQVLFFAVGSAIALITLISAHRLK